MLCLWLLCACACLCLTHGVCYCRQCVFSLPVRSAYSYVVSSADTHTRTQHADLRCECLFWNVMCVLCVPVFAFVALSAAAGCVCAYLIVTSVCIFAAR